jgi:hypothetical protein
MSEPVFLIALAIAGTTLVLVTGAIAGAIRGRGSPKSEVARLSDRMESHEIGLDDVRNQLADQASQLAELQERLDFAERMLAHRRDSSALGPGEGKA